MVYRPVIWPFADDSSATYAGGIILDDIDWQILNILQENARTPNAEIARRVDLAASAIFARIKKLEEAGYIAGYEARLTPGRLALGLVAFIAVRTDDPPGSDSAARLLCEIPEVQEVHHVAGEDCYVLKVRTADNAAFARLLRDRLGAVPSIRATRTTIVLETLKETARLPIPGSVRVAKTGGSSAGVRTGRRTKP